MDIFEKYLTCPGKTGPPLTIFEHSLHVLQVANYLIQSNRAAVQHPELVRAAALCHDVGKIAGDFRSGKWVHAPHTSEFLPQLLGHPHFQELLTLANAAPSEAERELLLNVCETHHYHSPNLLRTCKDVVLVPVADALASALEAGFVGKITEILRASPYLQVSLELVRSLGFTNGFDAEVHHIDLPGQFVEDLFLADMVFRVLGERFRERGILPLLQKASSLWVVGALDAIRSLLASLSSDPKQLYESVFEEQIYDSILSELPPVGSMQIDSVKYVLVSEAIACKLVIALYSRDSVRKLLEKNNLSHLADSASGLFVDGLGSGIEGLWRPIRTKLLELLPDLYLPENITRDIPKVADGSLARSEAGLYENPKKLAERKKDKQISRAVKQNTSVLAKANEKVASDAIDLLKLFDASGNYNRSVTNVLLEFLKMQMDITQGTYTLPLAQFVLLDGASLWKNKEVKNASLCPVCRRFQQEIQAQGLITGNPKTDSVFQTFRKARGQISVCRWCFLTGYVDLPIARISKDNNSITKSREYLLLTSPLSKDKLQWLVDFVRRGHTEDAQESDEDEPGPDAAELAELEAMMGLSGGYDQLAVLGLSRRRLSSLKGFVLPTSNVVGNLVGIRIPAERLIGEDRVSGAVRRELVKATMYDLYLATGAPSMHYNIVTDSAFSMGGRPIDLDEMRRASVAYRLANRYCRFGRYGQLNSGLFMLLLLKPRHAVTRILRTQRRESRGQYAPGEDRIKEVIEMTESIAQHDWKFDLGLKITATLVDVGLLPPARGFWKNPQEQFSGVELVKWLQRIKMIKDETSARAWGTQLINKLKAGDVTYKELLETKGIRVGPPGEETIGKILALVEEIIAQCKDPKHKCRLSEFSRDIAEMDYYLLFYYNQKTKEAQR
jgi:HD domain